MAASYSGLNLTIPKRPWVISAAMRPLADGMRAVGIEARKVSTRDILLAMRMDADDFDVDLPLSASIRADILANGTPQTVQGQVVAEKGTITDRGNDKVSVDIDHADFRFSWDGRRHALIMPFQVQSGGNQFTMRAHLGGAARAKRHVAAQYCPERSGDRSHHSGARRIGR